MVGGRKQFSGITMLSDMPDPAKGPVSAAITRPADLGRTLTLLDSTCDISVPAADTAEYRASIFAADLVASRLIRLRVSGRTTVIRKYPEGSYGLCFLLKGRGSVVLPGTTAEIPLKEGMGYILSTGAVVKCVMGQEAEFIKLLIPSHIMVRSLETLAGGPIADEPKFDPYIDARHGAALSVWHAIEMASRDVRHPDSLLRRPVRGALCEEFLCAALLMGVGHDYRDKIWKPQHAMPKNVLCAEEYMRAHAGEHIFLTDIAAAAGCSAHTLQLAFKHFRDTTPMSALKRIRLDRARADLLQGGKGNSVTQIAIRWGFGHLGLFAHAYKAAFGQSPSETLRYGNERVSMPARPEPRQTRRRR